MKINGIWRTGLLAAVITVVGAALVMSGGDWVKGLDSGFIALGQTGTTTPPVTTTGCGATTGTSTGTASGTTTTTTCITKIIPQIAAGSFDGNATKYSTTIEIVNTGTTAATLTGNFYVPASGAASTMAFTSNITAATVTSGALASTSLNPGAILVLTAGTTAATTPATGTVSWGKIVSTGSVSIATFFEIRDGSTSTLYGRVGVAASASNMSKFLIPRVRNVASGFDVAFALVNTGSTTANFTATLKDANGTTLSTKTSTLAANAQTALFASQFFALTGEPTGTSYSYIVVESTSASFAAIALAFEGANATSFPVEQLQ